MQYFYGLVFFVRAFVTIVALMLWCVTVPLLFILLQAVSYKKLDRIPLFFHRGACRIIGIRVKVEGIVSDAKPALFVGNHISYLDIFAVGSALSGQFIAKSDIADWPVMGKLARLQNTLFVERDPRKASLQITQMREYLEPGGRLILFPEGTSSMGTEVLPFKSSLFKAAELVVEDGSRNAWPVPIQPFAVSYTHVAGKPIDDAQRSRFAWHDDTPFAQHFMRILGARTVSVTLLFAEPVYIEDFDSRKDCANFCRDQVAELLASTI